MNFLFAVFTVSAFLVGFFCGAGKRKFKPVYKSKQGENALIELQKEYENFLNYDGTEQ